MEPFKQPKLTRFKNTLAFLAGVLRVQQVLAVHSSYSDLLNTCPVIESVKRNAGEAYPGEIVQTTSVQTNGYAQITKMEFCTYGFNGSGQTVHPIGFRFHFDVTCGEAGAVNPSTFDCGTFPPPAGLADPSQIACTTTNVGEDISFVRLGADPNDFEQVELTKWNGGAPFIVGTTDGGKDYLNWTLKGRPIGWTCDTGDRGFGGMTVRNPHGMGVVWNECNCPVSRFMPQTTPSNMQTTVSGPTDTQALPYFINYIEQIYDQDCGSYTVEFVPPYAFFGSFRNPGTGGGIYNKNYDDELRLFPTLDSEIGLWDVEMIIHSEVGTYGANNAGLAPFRSSNEADCNGNDVSSYKFKLQVDPCLPTIAFTQVAADMTYTIGTGQQASTPIFAVSQTPDCGYPVTCTVSGAPWFVTWWDDIKQFFIDAQDDLSVDGNYSIDVTCSIERYTDYTQTTTQTISTTRRWNLKVVDPCETAVLCTNAECPFDDLYTSVLGGPDSAPFDEKWDDVSLNYGFERGSRDGYEFCGSRSCYSVSPNYSFHTFNDAAQTSTIETSNAGHIGVWNVYITCRLDNYPAVKRTYTQRLEIIPCQILEMGITPEPQHNYHIYTPAQSITWVEWTQTPACNYPFDYTIRIENPDGGTRTNLPGWINYNWATRTFTYSTNNLAHYGTYNLSIYGCTKPSTQLNPQICNEQIIVLDVDNGCRLDQNVPTSTIPDDIYYLNKDGVVDYNPTWATQSVAGCPWYYDLKIVDNGVDRNLNAWEWAPLSHYHHEATQTGKLRANNNNYNYDGQTWTMKLMKVSTYSSSTLGDGAYIFDITWRDPCWDSVLQPPAVFDYTYDIWETQYLTFNQMADLTEGMYTCFGYTYQLEYQDTGPLWDTVSNSGPSLAHYSLDACLTASAQCYYGGVTSDFNWEGVHPFKIIATNGKYNAAQSRGNNGLWKTVESDVFYVTIRNPCRRSQPNAFPIRDFENWVWKPVPDEDTFTGTPNWAASRYGTGYDKCGELKYYAVDENYETTSHSYMSISYTSVANAADTIYISVQTNDKYKAGVHQFYLKVWLEDYPEAPAQYIPFTVTIHECLLEEFNAPTIPYTQYVVQERRHYIEFAFEQIPCDFVCTYSVQLVSSSGQVSDPPKFLQWSEDIASINVYSQDNTDKGLYTLRVGCLLDNELQSFVSTTFDLEVFASPMKIPANEDPFFAYELLDQCYEVGQQFSYTLGYASDVEGNIVSVEALIKDYDWLQFDDVDNTFTIRPSVVDNKDIGIYQINMLIKDDNKEDPASKPDNFTLEIRDYPCEQQVEQTDRFEPLFHRKKDWTIRNGTELGEYHEDQPVPYIHDLSQSGLLTIGWDRKMNPHKNYSEIYPDRLAVRQLYRTEAWFFEEPENWEYLTIVEALEITVEPGEMSDEALLNITHWECIGYNEEWIWIQLYFEYPEHVSEHYYDDSLSVTFWGTHFFKSSENNEVRYGTNLQTPIIRQVNKDSQSWVEWLAYFAETILILLCMVILLLSFGRLLPFWGFINTLQLITHSPLLRANMPASTVTVLTRLLNVGRFDWLPITNFVRTNWEFDPLQQGHSQYFRYLGYKQLNIVPLLGFFLVAAFVVLAVYLLLLLKDLFVLFIYRPRNLFMKYRHEPWMFNFATRFLYEAFLEICICSFVHIAHWHDQPSGNYIALALLLCSIAFLLVVEQFFWRQTHIGVPAKPVKLPVTLVDKWRNRLQIATGQFSKTKNETDANDYYNDLTINENQSHLDNSNIDLMHQQKPPRMQTESAEGVNQFDNQRPSQVDQSVSHPLDESGNKANSEKKQGDDNVEERTSNPNHGSISNAFAACFSKRKGPQSRTGQQYEQENGLTFEVIDRFEYNKNTTQFEGGQQEFESQAISTQTNPKHFPQKSHLHKQYRHKLPDTPFESYAKAVAKHNLMVEDRLKPLPRIKTLFYGLKMNTRYQVELVHPLMFLARRLAFAWYAVAMTYAGIRQVQLYILSSLAMLILLYLTKQWKDPQIQSFFTWNEWAVYITGLFLLVFVLESDGYLTNILGYVMIGFVLFFCITNVIFMWMKLLEHLKLYQVRSYLLNVVRKRELYKPRKQKKISKKTDMALGAMQPARNNKEDDSDYETPQYASGGVQVIESDLEKIKDEKSQQMSEVEEVPQMPDSLSSESSMAVNDFGITEESDGLDAQKAYDDTQTGFHKTQDHMASASSFGLQIETIPLSNKRKEKEVNYGLEFDTILKSKDITNRKVDDQTVEVLPNNGLEFETIDLRYNRQSREHLNNDENGPYENNNQINSNAKIFDSFRKNRTSTTSVDSQRGALRMAGHSLSSTKKISQFQHNNSQEFDMTQVYEHGEFNSSMHKHKTFMSIDYRRDNNLTGDNLHRQRSVDGNVPMPEAQVSNYKDNKFDIERELAKAEYFLNEVDNPTDHKVEGIDYNKKSQVRNVRNAKTLETGEDLKQGEFSLAGKSPNVDVAPLSSGQNRPQIQVGRLSSDSESVTETRQRPDGSRYDVERELAKAEHYLASDPTTEQHVAIAKSMLKGNQ